MDWVWWLSGGDGSGRIKCHRENAGKNEENQRQVHTVVSSHKRESKVQKWIQCARPYWVYMCFNALRKKRCGNIKKRKINNKSLRRFMLLVSRPFINYSFECRIVQETSLFFVVWSESQMSRVNVLARTWLDCTCCHEYELHWKQQQQQQGQAGSCRWNTLVGRLAVAMPESQVERRGPFSFWGSTVGQPSRDHTTTPLSRLIEPPTPLDSGAKNKII